MLSLYSWGLVPKVLLRDVEDRRDERGETCDEDNWDIDRDRSMVKSWLEAHFGHMNEWDEGNKGRLARGRVVDTKMQSSLSGCNLGHYQVGADSFRGQNPAHPENRVQNSLFNSTLHKETNCAMWLPSMGLSKGHRIVRPLNTDL